MDDFVRLTERLYAGCPYYVPDMDTDIRDTFDPRKNAGLDFSEIQPFIAYDENGNVVGRIAGIVNHRANEKWHTKNVRFGFNELTCLRLCWRLWSIGAANGGWIVSKGLWGYSISTRKGCSWRTLTVWARW